MSRAAVILFHRARAHTCARRVNTCTHAHAHGCTQAYMSMNVFTVFSLGIASQKASVTGKRPELLTKTNSRTHVRSMKCRNMRMHKRA